MNPLHAEKVAALEEALRLERQEHNRLILSTAGGFQEWWERQDLRVEHFKPCRAAWQAAQIAQRRSKGSVTTPQGDYRNE